MVGLKIHLLEDRLMKKLFLFLLPLIFSMTTQAKEPFFPVMTPPKGWLISDPTLFEEGVKIGFVQSQRKIFTPAISLSLEKIRDTALKDYLKVVRKLHETNPRNRYHELGYLETKSGKAHLSQIDMTNQWGDIRILQAIILHDGYAVIQTATALKKDFAKVQDNFLESFRSLTLSPDLLASLGDSAGAKQLKRKLETLKISWKKYCSSSSGKKEALFVSDFFQKNQWNFLNEEL